jgi:hypothetical protein
MINPFKVYRGLSRSIYYLFLVQVINVFFTDAIVWFCVSTSGIFTTVNHQGCVSRPRAVIFRIYHEHLFPGEDYFYTFANI